MRIREDNRNIFLLTTIALCCAVVTATFALFEPVFGQSSGTQVAESRPIEAATRAPTDQPPVRVVGAPFVPNVNPRQH